MNLEGIFKILRNNIEILFIGGSVILLVLLLTSIISLIKISNLKKDYRMLMKGTNNKSIENLIYDFKDLSQKAYERSETALDGIKLLNNQIQNCVQKVGVVRFKAFDDVGSNQSYSIAFLDNKSDGVIITSIFGRDMNTSYAKPISRGKSEYTLSEEEYLAVERALGINKK